MYIWDIFTLKSLIFSFIYDSNLAGYFVVYLATLVGFEAWTLDLEQIMEEW